MMSESFDTVSLMKEAIPTAPTRLVTRPFDWRLTPAFGTMEAPDKIWTLNSMAFGKQMTVGEFASSPRLQPRVTQHLGEEAAGGEVRIMTNPNCKCYYCTSERTTFQEPLDLTMYHLKNPVIVPPLMRFIPFTSILPQRKLKQINELRPCVHLGPIIGAVTQTSARLMFETNHECEVEIVLVARPWVIGLGPNLAKTDDEVFQPPDVRKWVECQANVPIFVDFRKLCPSKCSRQADTHHIPTDTVYHVQTDVPITNLTHCKFKTFPASDDDQQPISIAVVSGGFKCLKAHEVVLSNGKSLLLERMTGGTRYDMWKALYERQLREHYLTWHLGNNVICGGEYLYGLKDATSHHSMPHTLSLKESIMKEVNGDVGELFRQIYRRTLNHPWQRHAMASTANFFSLGELELGSYESSRGRSQLEEELRRTQRELSKRKRRAARTLGLPYEDSEEDSADPRPPVVIPPEVIENNGNQRAYDFAMKGRHFKHALRAFTTYAYPLQKDFKGRAIDFFRHWNVGALGFMDIDTRLFTTCFHDDNNLDGHPVIGKRQFSLVGRILDHWSDERVTNVMINIQQAFGDLESDWHVDHPFFEKYMEQLLQLFLDWRDGPNVPQLRSVTLMAVSKSASGVVYITKTGSKQEAIPQIVQGPIGKIPDSLQGLDQGWIGFKEIGQFTFEGVAACVDTESYCFLRFTPTQVPLAFGKGFLADYVKQPIMAGRYANTKKVSVEFFYLKPNGLDVGKKCIPLRRETDVVPPRAPGWSDQEVFFLGRRMKVDRYIQSKTADFIEKMFSDKTSQEFSDVDSVRRKAVEEIMETIADMKRPSGERIGLRPELFKNFTFEVAR
ncbi:MAG: hypothetical protein KVP17_001228 [Porospora cf. gigantea B]|uniref:uncharacterized protein n=1 Tax=Porospora cf. gigantea B TaxID=2853592 RepID=UPI003571F8DD|nr:MAG: hypothetical protein KVP17_001228 [Porospora cf. gigantea B]